MDGAFILAAIAEHDDGVPVGLGDEDVAPAQVCGLALVHAAGELGERASLVQAAGHVARAEPFRQAGNARVGAAYPHQRGAVRLAGRGHPGHIETDLLSLLVECISLILVVADLAVLAGAFHRLPLI